MQYKTVPALPNARISTIGFGCWSLGAQSGWTNSSDEESVATVYKAIDCGVTFFDTAPVYGFHGSETLLGRALQGKRDRIFLASKCGLLWDDNHVTRRDLSHKAVIADVEGSLSRLKTDHLDLLQLHWPDHETPLEETARALHHLLEQGKINAVGVTNYSVVDTVALAKLVPVSSYQGLYNLLERNTDSYHSISLEYEAEREIVPFCLERGMAFLPYSPLFQGLLTGRFNADSKFGSSDVRSANPKLAGDGYRRYVAAVEGLKPIAAAAGISMTHMSLAWLCQNPAVTSVLCGAHRPDQIADNAASADVVLSEKTLGDIKEVLERNGL